jgi:hypothetical protein
MQYNEPQISQIAQMKKKPQFKSAKSDFGELSRVAVFLLRVLVFL